MESDGYYQAAMTRITVTDDPRISDASASADLFLRGALAGTVLCIGIRVPAFKCGVSAAAPWRDNKPRILSGCGQHGSV
jgi:hypothetical protein